MMSQSVPVPGKGRKNQGTAVSDLSGWASPIYGAGFTVLWRAEHRLIQPSTSFLQLSKTTPSHHTPQGATTYNGQGHNVSGQRQKTQCG